MYLNIAYTGSVSPSLLEKYTHILLCASYTEK